ncbi:MAG: hypothetical protein AAFW48_01575 [Pseudomonadota bacterium]
MQATQTQRPDALSAKAPARSWTKPFHGIQHLGAGDRWATVEDKGCVAHLVCWFPGCGFRPDVTTHTDAEKTRQAGETWFGLFGHA